MAVGPWGGGRSTWPRDDQYKLALLASLVSMHIWPMVCARNGPLRLLLLLLLLPGLPNWVSGVALTAEELKPSCRRDLSPCLRPPAAGGDRGRAPGLAT